MQPYAVAGELSQVRGRVEVLPSGSLRVVVYAGIDPVTRRRVYLRRTVAAGADAGERAQAKLAQLLGQVELRSGTPSRVSLNRLLDVYVERLAVQGSTRDGYASMVRNHIGPLIGNVPVSRLDTVTLDAFFAQLRTCRQHCLGKRRVDHHTTRKHSCNRRCVKHVCLGLAPASVRNIHRFLSGVLKFAVALDWLPVNPIKKARIPAPVVKPNPRPPSLAEAVKILEAAWADPDWGMLLWLTMTTGARRGEVCALTWDRLDLDGKVLRIETATANTATNGSKNPPRPTRSGGWR